MKQAGLGGSGPNHLVGSGLVLACGLQLVLKAPPLSTFHGTAHSAYLLAGSASSCFVCVCTGYRYLLTTPLFLFIQLHMNTQTFY